MVLRRTGARISGTATTLLVLLALAHSAGATATCPGDCNADGSVGIEELVGAVEAALTAADGCMEYDLDADGVVAVHELLQLVDTALDGCPPPFDAALVDGVYDVLALSQTDPSGGLNRNGIAVIEAVPNGLRIALHFGLLESFVLLGTAQPDGWVAVQGDGTIGGEFAQTVAGDAQLTELDGVIELRGALEFKYTLAPYGALVDVRFTRARSGTPSAYAGVQRFTLRHPLEVGDAATTRIDLPISVPPSGRATCGAAADRFTDGRLRAELPEAECLVSPSGRFLYTSPYRLADSEAPLPLQMWGTIAAGSGAVGRGTFAVAAFPEVAETGVWEAEPASGAE